MVCARRSVRRADRIAGRPTPVENRRTRVSCAPSCQTPEVSLPFRPPASLGIAGNRIEKNHQASRPENKSRSRATLTHRYRRRGVPLSGLPPPLRATWNSRKTHTGTPPPGAQTARVSPPTRGPAGPGRRKKEKGRKERRRGDRTRGGRRRGRNGKRGRGRKSGCSHIASGQTTRSLGHPCVGRHVGCPPDTGPPLWASHCRVFSKWQR